MIKSLEHSWPQRSIYESTNENLQEETNCINCWEGVGMVWGWGSSLDKKHVDANSEYL